MYSVCYVQGQANTVEALPASPRSDMPHVFQAGRPADQNLPRAFPAANHEHSILHKGFLSGREGVYTFSSHCDSTTTNEPVSQHRRF